jgi:molybdopterin biosynthesis enzyme
MDIPPLANTAMDGYALRCDDSGGARPDAPRRLRVVADLFLTSGGVSVGDFDVVKTVLAAEGQITFWRVRVKPGKPVAFGTIHGVPLLGLPGNPVAAMISFELFARPAILTMLGKTKLARPTVDAILVDEVKRKDDPPALPAGDLGRARGHDLRPADGRSGLGHPALHGQSRRPGHHPRGRRPPAGRVAGEGGAARLTGTLGGDLTIG